MRIATAALLALALGSAAGVVTAEDAGPGDTSRSTVAQLDPGTYWWGAKIDKEDLQGRVVLFVAWGS